MKKTIYTIAFIALFNVISNAQTATQEKKAAPAKAETVNPDGTSSPAVAPAPTDDKAKQEGKSTKAQKQESSGTRMAITEKGVPASKKATETKKSEPKKTEPAKAEKGQQ